jgi:hypothetical protein
MKHLHSFDSFIAEGLSKINPGKRLIQSGLAGAPSASKYLAAAKKALETWVKMAEEISKARAAKDKAKVKELFDKKKEILSKLLELKKDIQGKVADELKDVPKEKQVKAKEKAEAVSKQFTDAIKKREQKAAKIEGSEAEGGAVDAEKIKTEMEKIKAEMTSKEDEFYNNQNEERSAWEKKMQDDGYSASDWTGDNGWNEATDMYDDFQNEVSQKENAFYKTLQSLADKYTELEKQLNAEGEKNESYIWEAIDRILEFDAQAMADKAKEKAEETEDEIKDLEAKKDGGEDEEEEGGEDEEEVQDDDAIEAEIEKLEAEWEKKKDELLAGMEQAEQDGDDGPGGKKDELQSQYADAEEEFNRKKEELEDKLSTPESVNYSMKNYQTFEQFVNERFNPVNEGKVIYKRGYTNNYPARFANEKAAVRNVVIGSIKDGVITEEEFQKILSETGAHGRWSSRNGHLFNVTKEGVKLSSYGLKIWERVKGGTMISEGRAFISKLKEAREKGEKTFEFNGKTFTVKASKLNEDN